MNRPFLAFILLFATLAPTFVRAASAAHDLGAGLAYYRLATLPADLPAPATATACVLDLRYASGDAAAGDALLAWLKFHASARHPVLLLANAGTAPALLSALAPATLPGGTLTLGLPAPDFAPDVIIRTTAETERRAYDALAAGTPLNALVEEKITKPRHDEAEIVRRQAAREPLEPETDTAAPVVGASATSSPPPAPLIDATLQRAVHLHRALQALGR